MRRSITVICLLFGLMELVGAQSADTLSSPPSLDNSDFWVFHKPKESPVCLVLGVNADFGSEVQIDNVPAEIRTVNGFLIKKDGISFNADEGFCLAGKIYFFKTVFLRAGFTISESFVDRAEEKIGDDYFWYGFNNHADIKPHLGAGLEWGKFFCEYIFNSSGEIVAKKGTRRGTIESYEIGKYRSQLLRVGFLIDDKKVTRLWAYVGISSSKFSLSERFAGFSLKMKTNFPILGLNIDIFLNSSKGENPS